MVSVRDELFLKLVEASVSGRLKDTKMLLRVLASEFESSHPELANKVAILAGNSALRNSQVINPHPIEVTKTPSMLIDLSNEPIEIAPVLSDRVLCEIKSVLDEHKYSQKLIDSKLTPIKTIIFEGPPGVGKTLTAKWVAKKLNYPLYVLDLASVMNSHLGKTGNNIKEVFDFVSKNKCVLLLDEFDAIAKKRGDDSEIGELKRLVTVLLQALDGFKSSSIIIAATNHSELLDPAIWRRFEKKITFNLPDRKQLEGYMVELTGDEKIKKMSLLFYGMNYSDIDYFIKRAKKDSIINDNDFNRSLVDLLVSHKNIEEMQLSEKKEIGLLMCDSGFSQRDAAKRAFISRPTLKKELDEREVD